MNSLGTCCSDFVAAGCREYAAGPLLTRFAPGKEYATRRKELGLDPLPSDESYSSSQAVSWADLRRNKLLDSGLSGALTGGVLRSIRSKVLESHYYSQH